MKQKLPFARKEIHLPDDPIGEIIHHLMEAIFKQKTQPQSSRFAPECIAKNWGEMKCFAYPFCAGNERHGRSCASMRDACRGKVASKSKTAKV
jgi:hypothetical protein